MSSQSCSGLYVTTRPQRAQSAYCTLHAHCSSRSRFRHALIVGGVTPRRLARCLAAVVE